LNNNGPLGIVPLAAAIAFTAMTLAVPHQVFASSHPENVPHGGGKFFIHPTEHHVVAEHVPSHNHGIFITFDEDFNNLSHHNEGNHVIIDIHVPH
jgi:hypothetical protein